MKLFIKKMLEKILYNIYSKDYKELYEIINKYDYVSFDIFDTLIKRNVKDPTDIFDVIEKVYSEKYSTINNFKEIRIKAEESARKNSDKEEITLKEIYKEMSNYNNKEKEILQNLEIQIEKDFCIQNKPIYDFYNYCIKHNKKIFFTSDMYLELDVVKDMLNKAGYENYEKIYLSSKDKLRKRTGNLFKKLLNENSISKDKFIHIGDSITGDFLIPKKLGINSILIPRKVKNSMFFSKSNKSLEYNILSSFINNNVHNLTDFEHLGYEVLGPILYGFTSWIHEKIKEDKIDKLYFLARDAKIIMEIYKKRYNESIPIYYLEVSRRSVLIGTLGEVNSLDEILVKYKSIIKDTSKVVDLINILNLDINKYHQEDYFNKLIIDLSDKEKNQIYSLIKDDLLKEYKCQNKYLKEYLKQKGLSGNVALIDIGWNGTIQYLLNNIVDKNTKLYGYYVGVMKDKKYREYNTIRNGYLFDLCNQNDNQSIIGLNIGLFETMFLSTEGSTIKYKNTDKNIEVVHGDVEYSKENIKAINQIQDSAFKFIEDIEKSEIKNYLNYSNKEIYFETFKNITIHPTLQNINLVKNIEFQNFNKDSLINNKSLLYYMFHLKCFYSDFMNSCCKVFFMKNTFKIGLPYYRVLKKIYIKSKIN